MMGGNLAQTKNPFYSIANQFLPRNLNDVIRWTRFITTHSPLTAEVMRKFATYPITDFVYEVKDRRVKEQYEKIEKSFKLKTTLHDVGFQFHTIGNVFVSIHFPIHRSYKCPNTACGDLLSGESSANLKFKNYKFEGTCPRCFSSGIFSVVDKKSLNIEDMNVILWDPMNISVNHNTITGKSQYYYSIPGDMRRKIQTGDRFIIDSIPWEFVEAVKNNRDFLFAPDRIFHLRNVDMGMSVNGIAVPPLISHFGLVFYQAMLRRANESISSDFMAPMRVVFPQAQSGNSEPVIAMSMRNFVSRMEEAFVKHKNDSSHVVVAPVPIGYQSISGEGKTLLVSAEIEQAEDSLLLSMGVSRELLSGTTNWTSSTVGLRLLKNTLDSYVRQITELIQWIFTCTTNYLKIPTHVVGLSPFSLTDDEMIKNMAMNLAGNGNMSLTTLYESMGRSYEEELECIESDAKIKARHDVRVKYEVERAEYLEGLAINKVNKDDGYTEVLQQAQDMANQLAGTDPATAHQVLNELKVQDYAKFLMVSKLLEETRSIQTRAMNQQAEQDLASQQGGEDPEGAADQDPESQGLSADLGAGEDSGPPPQGDEGADPTIPAGKSALVMRQEKAKADKETKHNPGAQKKSEDKKGDDKGGKDDKKSEGSAKKPDDKSDKEPPKK